MATARRLSALIVNYNSGSFAIGCVRSLQHAWRKEGYREEDLEIIVVENASPIDQTAELAVLEELGARVVHSEVNGGYSGGMNLAWSHSSGSPDDFVAILNPDLCFLPGSITPLLDYLAENADCGVVAPRTTIDMSGELHISRDLLPTPLEQLRTTLARMSPAWCRRYGARRLRLALEWWLSEGPLDCDMVTGCCLFLRRGVIEEDAPPMDEAYPLYFEDTDLYRRLKKRGYRIVRHGSSHVLHHWSRSAGVGVDFEGEPLRRYWISFDHYFKKHFGRLGHAIVRGMHRIESKWPQSKLHRPMHKIEPLGAFDEPFDLRFDRARRFVIEIGLAPTWIVTIGVVGEGASWRAPQETWDWFFETGFFLRAFDRDTNEFLGAWHFEKRGAGRTEPVTIEEIENR